jgi:hypothetical protein
MWKQSAFLRNESNASFMRRNPCLLVGNDNVVDLHRTLLRAFKSSNDAKESGLAFTRRPEERCDTSVLHLQIDVIQHLSTPKEMGDVGEFKSW